MSDQTAPARRRKTKFDALTWEQLKDLPDETMLWMPSFSEPDMVDGRVTLSGPPQVHALFTYYRPKIRVVYRYAEVDAFGDFLDAGHAESSVPELTSVMLDANSIRLASYEERRVAYRAYLRNHLAAIDATQLKLGQLRLDVLKRMKKRRMLVK